MVREPTDYDLLGIGFGPSNLSLAIALEEMARQRRMPVRAQFVERQPGFTWHGGMLLPDSDMQISFLKDLVSLRDPTSPLTFVNYLHSKGRLEDFANCRTFYPSRVEFNDYLRWVAVRFADECAYGEEIVEIEPLRSGDIVTSLGVVSRDASGQTRIRRARNISVAVGGIPHVPPLFATLQGQPRLCHSSRYLAWIDGRDLDRKDARIAVIGGGQSAAEITLDLHKRFSHAAIDLIFRGHALKPSDSSPFVNEIFHPTYTDFVYEQPAAQRGAIVRAFRNTNYAVVDPDLLEALHKIVYAQKVEGGGRLALHPRNVIGAVEASARGITLAMTDHFAAMARRETYDAVILATGYDRSARHSFLAPLERYIEDHSVDRTYRLKMREGFEPTIYMQGYSENSHGISDTLLSVLAIRSSEISRSILDGLDTYDACGSTIARLAEEASLDKAPARASWRPSDERAPAR